MNIIKINTEYIKLDSFLKLTDTVPSGGVAKHVIQEGLVKVNSKTETRRGLKLRDGDIVEFEGEKFQVKVDEIKTSRSERL